MENETDYMPTKGLFVYVLLSESDHDKYLMYLNDLALEYYGIYFEKTKEDSFIKLTFHFNSLVHGYSFSKLVNKYECMIVSDTKAL